MSSLFPRRTFTSSASERHVPLNCMSVGCEREHHRDAERGPIGAVVESRSELNISAELEQPPAENIRRLWPTCVLDQGRTGGFYDHAWQHRSSAVPDRARERSVHLALRPRRTRREYNAERSKETYHHHESHDRLRCLMGRLAWRGRMIMRGIGHVNLVSIAIR